MTKYPTKEKILRKEVRYPRGLIAIVKKWKQKNFKNWATKANSDKFVALADLLDELGRFYNRPLQYIKLDDQYCYLMEAKAIWMDKNHPSILSTLHEFGHHIHGSSEVKACRFSVWLFRKAFPKTYEQLEWDGHMLKRRAKQPA